MVSPRPLCRWFGGAPVRISLPPPWLGWESEAVAPIGVVANLAAVPLAGFAVPGLFASIALGSTMAAGTGAVRTILERIAEVASRVPFGHIRETAGVAFAVPWFGLLIVTVWLCRATWAVARVRLTAAVAASSWGIAAESTWRATDRYPGLALYFLDVGQGDAIAIRTPRGRWLLVDAGPRTLRSDAGRSVVLPFLRRQAVPRLDVLVATHADADHLGGVPAVVRALDPALVLEPAQAHGTRLYLEYLEALDRTGATWRAARAGDTLVADSVTVAVLHPSPAWARKEIVPNENSVVVRVSYGAFDAILTGDIGAAAEAHLLGSVGDVEVLKVAHHGSAGSTTAAWLEAVDPDAAVISVGSNSYGHPAPEVLERLAKRGIRVFRTDRGGTVTIRSNGRYFSVEQGRPATLRETLRCLVRRLTQSSDSSWSRNGCTREQPENFPISSTTSRLPPRSSRATCVAQGSSTFWAALSRATCRERFSKSST